MVKCGKSRVRNRCVRMLLQRSRQETMCSDQGISGRGSGEKWCDCMCVATYTYKYIHTHTHKDFLIDWMKNIKKKELRMAHSFWPELLTMEYFYLMDVKTESLRDLKTCPKYINKMVASVEPKSIWIQLLITILHCLIYLRTISIC